jgi:alkaline phosphatase
MPRKKILVFGLILAGSLVLGYLGSNYFLKQVNTSLVYYDAGKTLTIGTQTTNASSLPLSPDKPIRNIILFIGDGMGLSHLTAARINSVGPDGRFHLDRMPVTGLVTTHAVDNLITDSAAAGTALATGVKTTNGSIGVDSSGASHPTILETARDAGLSTGLVTTTYITDATPATFAAHVRSRAMKDEIALQLLNARVNVLFGEGDHFYPKSDSRSARKDDANPLVLAQELGYTIIEKKEGLANANTNFLLGLFADLTTDRMKPNLQSPSQTPSLAELTAKALEVLNRNEKGFFLMVEEEGVDMGSHVNREDYFIHHLNRLDEAIKIGVDFAARDERTLVLVTADHETGGVNIIGGVKRKNKVKLAWATDRHTGQPVPLFAFGPHALRFTGLKDNTEIPKIMAELLQLEKFLKQ